MSDYQRLVLRCLQMILIIVWETAHRRAFLDDTLIAGLMQDLNKSIKKNNASNRNG